MIDRPDGGTRRLARTLGAASAGLGLPMLLATHRVARLAGVDDSGTAQRMIRATGARELVHAASLLAGPPTAVWGRVAGDALDLAAVGAATRRRTGSRQARAAVATALVAGIAAVDVYAALRAARTNQHGRGRPGPLHLEASVTVNQSPQGVYEHWRDFSRLPTFMAHLREVTVEPGGTVSHWSAVGPLGRTVRWDAELTGDEPGRRISWRSLPGADVDNSGTVHFAPAPGDRGTEVRVTLHYDVPGGAVGRAIARMLGEEPVQQVRDDLRRFKQVVETGDIVRSDGLPGGTLARSQGIQRPAQPVGAEGGR